ncbi:MAG: hypothetical protein J0H52_16570, partial [Comamonadaceae bacterium]|nr:hypothetical protein [Comamonadaceae bacterium]MBN9369181.1 hypothetical protein [Comamonadaceae bacterium]
QRSLELYIEFSFNHNSKPSSFFTTRTSCSSSEALDHSTEKTHRATNKEKIYQLRYLLPETA